MTANTGFVVKVPATTANLGPGFDCLGMALDIWNTVEIEVGGSGVEISGEGADVLSRDGSNLIIRCFRRVYSEGGRKAPSVRVASENQVPVGRGLGSSTTAVVAGLTAGNEACGRPLTQERLLEIATGDRGTSGQRGRRLPRWMSDRRPGRGPLGHGRPAHTRRPTRRLIYSQYPMPTEQARELLSSKVERRDAVYNIGGSRCSREHSLREIWSIWPSPPATGCINQPGRPCSPR